MNNRTFEGDLHEQYARVCNQCLEAPLGSELLDLKEEMERRLAEESMEEYGWIRDKSGKWHWETPEQFATRYRAGRKVQKKIEMKKDHSFMKLSGSLEEAREICSEILKEAEKCEQKEHFIWKAKHQRGLSDEQIQYFLDRDTRYNLMPYYSLCCKRLGCEQGYAEVVKVYGKAKL